MHAVVAPVITPIVIPIVVVTPVVTPIVVVTWTVPSWAVVVVVVPVVIVDVDIGIAVVPIRSVVVVPPISPIAVAVPIIVAVAVPIIVAVSPIIVAVAVPIIVAVPIWTVPTSAIGPVAAIWAIRVHDAGQCGNATWTISATNARSSRLGRRAIQAWNIVWTIVDATRTCDAAGPCYSAGPCNAAGAIATLVRAIPPRDVVSAKTRSGLSRWLPTV